MKTKFDRWHLALIVALVLMTASSVINAYLAANYADAARKAMDQRTVILVTPAK